MIKKSTVIVIAATAVMFSACGDAGIQGTVSESTSVTVSATESTVSETEREKKEKIMETAEIINIGLHDKETVAFFSDSKNENGGMIVKTSRGSKLNDCFFFGKIVCDKETEKEHYDFNSNEKITIKTATYTVMDEGKRITFEKGTDKSGNVIIVFENGELRSVRQGSIDDLMILVNEYDNSTNNK